MGLLLLSNIPPTTPPPPSSHDDLRCKVVAAVLGRSCVGVVADAAPSTALEAVTRPAKEVVEPDGGRELHEDPGVSGTVNVRGGVAVELPVVGVAGGVEDTANPTEIGAHPVVKSCETPPP